LIVQTPSSFDRFWCFLQLPHVDEVADRFELRADQDLSEGPEPFRARSVLGGHDDTQANSPTKAMNAGEFGRANQSDHHVL
jgi:hypothetical protein